MKNRVSYNSIKEAIDYLPNGVCYFDERGLIVICNTKMYELYEMIAGSELQLEREIREVISESDDSLKKWIDKPVVHTENDEYWQIEQHKIDVDENKSYTEYVASDVTELILKYKGLEQDNVMLEQMNKRLNSIIDNVAIQTKEEEMLSFKIKVHNQMGECLLAAKSIMDGNDVDENTVMEMWKKSLFLLESMDENKDRDPISEVKKITDDFIKIKLSGFVPYDKEIRYVISLIMRECATNAYRHGGADELYIVSDKDDGFIRIKVRDNGKLKDEVISEGGGLSSLRKKIESCSGSMVIGNKDGFEMDIMLPV